MEIQWLSSISSDTDRLGKQRGPGSPRRFFRPLLGVQKWARRRQAGVRGMKPPLKGTRAGKALEIRGPLPTLSEAPTINNN